jgi:hypothetical protein
LFSPAAKIDRLSVSTCFNHFIGNLFQIGIQRGSDIGGFIVAVLHANANEDPVETGMVCALIGARYPSRIAFGSVCIHRPANQRTVQDCALSPRSGVAVKPSTFAPSKYDKMR